MEKFFRYFFLLVSAVVSCCSFSYAQEQHCHERSSADYYRRDNVNHRMFEYSGEILNTYLVDTISFGGNLYNIERTSSKYRDDEDVYLRKTTLGLVCYDKSFDTEHLVFPKDVYIGRKWGAKKASTRYEVVDMNARVQTPFCDFTDLVKVKVTIGINTLGNSNLYNYYKLGVGLVASEDVSGRIWRFLLPATGFYRFEECKVKSSNESVDRFLWTKAQDIVRNSLSDRLFNNNRQRSNPFESSLTDSSIYYLFFDDKGNLTDYFCTTERFPMRVKSIPHAVKSILKNFPTVMPATLNGVPIASEVIVPVRATVIVRKF